MNKIILDNRTFYYQVFFKKNKNLYLRIKQEIITITCPKRFSIREIENFIIKHKKHVLLKSEIKRIPLYDLENFYLWGLKVDKENIIETLKLRKKSDNFITDKMIENLYKDETLNLARELINSEFKDLIADIDLNDIVLKSQLMRSRLGSCNIKTKRINLNSILARFDKFYLRAVLIHEIVHLKEANHQKKFYDLLLKYEPNYRFIKKEINQKVKMYEI